MMNFKCKILVVNKIVKRIKFKSERRKIATTSKLLVITSGTTEQV